MIKKRNLTPLQPNHLKTVSLNIPKEKKQWINNCNEITSNRGWYDNEHLKKEKE
jgi:hypothetical protein